MQYNLASEERTGCQHHIAMALGSVRNEFLRSNALLVLKEINQMLFSPPHRPKIVLRRVLNKQPVHKTARRSSQHKQLLMH